MLLADKLSSRRLILASHSPRRRELLAASGLPHIVAPDYPVEETFPADLDPARVPVHIAQSKSEAYPEPLAAGDILLTADTVVLLDGAILGKPRNRDHARDMLRRLSGNRHEVITGVVLRDPKWRMSFAATTSVWFRELREEEIDYYVDNFPPLDKAGAYGIQDWIGYVGIERIDGSFYNVMGLPLQRLCVELENFMTE